MFKVYLAGKMQGRRGSEVIAERDAAVDACRASGLFPIDPAASEYIEPAFLVDMSMPYDQMKSYVEKDEYAVRNCDAVIVLTGDTPSEGTGCELMLAWTLYKPVVLVAPKRLRGELMGFWNVKASKIVETVQDAVDYLAENYNLEDF